MNTPIYPIIVYGCTFWPYGGPSWHTNIDTRAIHLCTTLHLHHEIVLTLFHFGFHQLVLFCIAWFCSIGFSMVLQTYLSLDHSSDSQCSSLSLQLLLQYYYILLSPSMMSTGYLPMVLTLLFCIYSLCRSKHEPHTLIQRYCM